MCDKYQNLIDWPFICMINKHLSMLLVHAIDTSFVTLDYLVTLFRIGKALYENREFWYKD